MEQQQQQRQQSGQLHTKDVYKYSALVCISFTCCKALVPSPQCRSLARSAPIALKPLPPPPLAGISPPRTNESTVGPGDEVSDTR